MLLAIYDGTYGTHISAHGDSQDRIGHICLKKSVYKNGEFWRTEYDDVESIALRATDVYVYLTYDNYLKVKIRYDYWPISYVINQTGSSGTFEEDGITYTYNYDTTTLYRRTYRTPIVASSGPGRIQFYNDNETTNPPAGTSDYYDYNTTLKHYVSYEPFTDGYRYNHIDNSGNPLQYLPRSVYEIYLSNNSLKYEYRPE